MLSLFQHAEFLLGAHEERDLPPPRGREIAFAGRSNAGKSSAINVLANRNRLAYVSRTPGRTQQINFYSLGDERYLVDLPGYGYAGVPLQLKKHWEMLLSNYVGQRETLCGLVIIMDSRHPLTPLDRQLLDWFAPRGRPVHILLTKADKLSNSAAIRTLRTVEQEIRRNWPHATVQLFSALKRTGLDEARSTIGAMLDPDLFAAAE